VTAATRRLAGCGNRLAGTRRRGESDDMGRSHWFGLAATALLIGCSDQVHTGTIAWYRTPCEAITAHLCAVMTDETGTSTAFYNPIEGYTPIWGVEAEVRYTIDDASGDDAVGAYVIDQVVTTRAVPAGAPAMWHLSPGWTWFAADGDQLTLLGVPVACTAAVCADVLTRDEAGVSFVIDVEATGDPTRPVRAIAAHAP
jgi:hypothetical protein